MTSTRAGNLKKYITLISHRHHFLELWRNKIVTDLHSGLSIFGHGGIPWNAVQHSTPGVHWLLAMERNGALPAGRENIHTFSYLIFV